MHPALKKALSCLSIVLFCTVFSCSQPTSYVPCSDALLAFENGLLVLEHTPYTGCLFALYNTGDTLFCKQYTNGLANGLHKTWYSNNRLAQQLHYAQGRPDSLQKAWWENGRRRFEMPYKKGQLHGNVLYWYSSGLQKNDQHYQQGREEGLQTFWGKDGRPHKLYEVKNGIIINMTLIKNCVYVP